MILCILNFCDTDVVDVVDVDVVEIIKYFNENLCMNDGRLKFKFIC